MNAKYLIPAALAVIWAAPASAVILADYEGVSDNFEVLDFYNGGTDGNGVAGPVDVNLVFSSDIFASQDGGGAAAPLNSFANEPSDDTVMYYTEDGVVINVLDGFKIGASFFYSQMPGGSGDSTVSVFSGLNGTGTPLGSLTLSDNWQDGSCDTGGGQFCNWQVGSIGFGGATGMSIVLAGGAGRALFDQLTIGSTNPVPLPAAAWLLGSGLLGFAALRRRRQVA